MPTGEFIDSTAYAGYNNREKTAAWSEWSSRRLTNMRVLYDAGLLGPENKEWRNVAEHSLVVNATAMFLAQEISENNSTLLDMSVVDDSSILHDVTKRMEREAGISYATEHDATLKHDFLESYGYADQVIRATEYTGRVPEMYLEDEDEQWRAIVDHPIEELIVAYADARVRNTNIVPLELARDMNKEKVPQDKAVYDKWYAFYKKVEHRLLSLTNDHLRPEDITNENVMRMVQEAQVSAPSLEHAA